MTAADFKAIEEAFQHALELEDDAREAYLKELTNEHSEIAARVRQLLKADAATGDSFAGPIAASVKALAEETEDPWVGRTVGDWRVVSRIGAGGMGAVFLAERADDEYAQKVALKVMGAQLLDQNAAARFRAERQILANLNHPNIAMLVDGGSTDDGLPYLVMEYVDGVRIDEFCDANNLNIRARLGLFQQLCNAVDYAHRNLVVHRDLKPSNMLVTTDGNPKLLDFGIAKLLEPEAYEMTMARTGDGSRVMTPEYASPEQVRGEPVSVATDVYAMGVLLFRLLTGHSPYGPSLTTPREIESAILDADPKKPSVSVTEYSDGAETTQSPSSVDTGENRSTTPDRLRKMLSGDLDNIVLKCLQKNPERRYATARELNADIHCYLNNQPILARGDSWPYKTKKFLARNTRAVAAATAVLSALILMTSFYTIRLADERDAADLAAAEAEQISEFLQNVFEGAAPSVDQGAEITARDLLRGGVEKIDELVDQPLLQGKLLRVMAESYYQLGDYQQAKVIYEKSEAKLELVSPPDILELAETYHSLADTLRILEDFDQSLIYRHKALEIFQQELGATHFKSADALARLGVTLSAAGRCDLAIPHIEEAYRILMDNAETDLFVSLNTRGVLVFCYNRVGRLDEAEKIGREIVRESEKHLGENVPNTIIRIHNLGLTLRRQWRLEQAIQHFEIAIERGLIIWPQTHLRHRTSRSNYAETLVKFGRFNEAEAQLLQVQELALTAAGRESVDYAASLYHLGILNKDIGNLEIAFRQFNECSSIASISQGASGKYSLICKLQSGILQRMRGEYTAAAQNLRAVLNNVGGVDLIYGIEARIELARTLVAIGEHEEAESISGDLDDIGRDIDLLISAAAYKREFGNVVSAAAYAKEAVREAALMLPDRNWLSARANAEYAYALSELGQNGEAKRLAAEAHAGLTATFGPDDYRVKPLKALIDWN